MTTDETGAAPEPIALTADEQDAIARAFERTSSLFGLLSTVRTRRMAWGTAAKPARRRPSPGPAASR